MDAITLDLAPFIQMTDDQFFELCQHHRDYRFERNAAGALIIMSPAGGETSRRNLSIAGQLYQWNQRCKLGIAFDSSGGFKLPNGADRSPDASWLTLERWQALTLAERQKFLPLCPDFVVELRSPSDSLTKLQEKMQEYMASGARLGWLIDPQGQQVEIYRLGQLPEVLISPAVLLGEDVLSDFELDLSDIL
ncbi:Uma2 family endonuclease [Acaryochloris sp. IP29b_bin.148]|uniref:Uma2 family endonuclease n=1 Tax=Acaryochloris sp. IP29b_bin.148 TaxID=2969218 RepID=UPI0026044A07|nr:Uma2 family endonuclease [Acaryochloris sp. IP29b_bin.148]